MWATISRSGGNLRQPEDDAALGAAAVAGPRPEDRDSAHRRAWRPETALFPERPHQFHVLLGPPRIPRPVPRLARLHHGRGAEKSDGGPGGAEDPAWTDPPHDHRDLRDRPD